MYRLGVDIGGGGKLSPDYGIVYKDCEGLIIEANADYKGAVKQNVVCLDK